MNLPRFFGVGCALLAATALPGEAWVRWNQQGYAPVQRKEVIVMSARDLTGEPWALSQGGDTVLDGRIISSAIGANDHSPFSFHYRINLTGVSGLGEYTLKVPDAADALIRVRARPYAALASLPLRHLRMQRSGTDTVLWRRASHRGDAKARVSVPAGDPDNGAWAPTDPARYIDVSGGWYDAGDHLKFTLTTAYTVYHLLLAYEIAPDIFGREFSTTGLPDLLDEAKYGLDYLVKLMPDADTFIVQVGDAVDHNQGRRLPADDKLDGARPALAALSRVHLAAAAAALAKGARIFADEPGQEEVAATYGAMARRMLVRAQMEDTILTAFERDQVNDFYRDNSVNDQMALAALELFRLTQRPEFLDLARAHEPGAARQVGWAHWHWLANRELARRGDVTAVAMLREEVSAYTDHAAGAGQPWGIPMRYVWGSLTRWVGAANAAKVSYPGTAESDRLFDDMLDYVFGRNPWGVSFLYDERLPNTLLNLYSPTAALLKRFPVGAFSAGPTRRSTHESMRQYFEIPPGDPFERFNTEAMVFYDNAHDFVCQEATIGGQADIILMLALAAADR